MTCAKIDIFRYNTATFNDFRSVLNFLLFFLKFSDSESLCPSE